MKRILQISLFIIAIVAVSGLMGFIYFEQANHPVSEIVVNIGRETPNGFLTEERIKQLIPDFDSLQTKRVKDIEDGTIEKLISKNPFVRQTDVFINIDKDIIINVSEKNPVIRIFNKSKEGFYIDDQGNIFPLSKDYTAHVLVINGYLDVEYIESVRNIYDTNYKETPLVDLFEISQLIRKNDFLQAQISQIYVNSKGEYDLIPELGNHLIRLGTIEHAEKKLDNLEVFYKKALIKEGWDKYEIINLKYKDQVVCKKK